MRINRNMFPGLDLPRLVAAAKAYYAAEQAYLRTLKPRFRTHEALYNLAKDLPAGEYDVARIGRQRLVLDRPVGGNAVYVTARPQQRRVPADPIPTAGRRTYGVLKEHPALWRPA